jgi:hypothetical protein
MYGLLLYQFDQSFTPGIIDSLSDSSTVLSIETPSFPSALSFLFIELCFILSIVTDLIEASYGIACILHCGFLKFPDSSVLPTILLCLLGIRCYGGDNLDIQSLR